MKFIIILAFLATLCVGLNSVEAQQCGKHEVYLQCGPSCPPTCESPSPSGPNCPMVCKAGCHCKPKYIRNAKGECVKPGKCSTGFFG
ncbi:chymotrypsin inhibitor [Culex quinquefasciatus]|uniref:chymotrypsin inhibitor n=1 Tax=Culex quinquefasciatus TaxID=7176 RepID=UPI0018E2C3D7|nr:chymotrypsin inhibitor [Culex quinquefasciatus]